MLVFRKNLMDVIIHSPDSFSIEVLIRNLLNLRFNNISSELIRFLHLIESDVIFQLRQTQSRHNKRNLLEANRVIKEINAEIKFNRV
jgi:hypothetical protein